MSKRYSENNLVSFKLISGDEIIGRIVKDSEKTGYVLHHPVIVVFTPQGKTMLPALLSGDMEHDITVEPSKVLFHGPTGEDDERHYVKITSGIDLPKPKILMG